MFDTSGHPVDAAARRAGQPVAPEEVKPIVIGDNVWIGRGSIIFPGVTIGENSVVSAGSAVLSNVPPNTLVAGYPARRVNLHPIGVSSPVVGTAPASLSQPVPPVATSTPAQSGAAQFSMASSLSSAAAAQ
jgi:hypothetical protein